MCWVSFRSLSKLGTALERWVCPALLWESFLGFQVPFVGLLCWFWEHSSQAAPGCFLCFGIQSDCLFLLTRGIERLQGQLRGKRRCVLGWFTIMGWALLPVLAGTGTGIFLCYSFWYKKLTKPVSTHLCCQRPCRSPLLHPNHPIIPQILPLRALSAVGDPLLIFVHLCRQESQAHPQVYMAGCDGLVLPADVFASLQAQGQILVRSGVSVLLLSLHTLPNWAKFATSC